MIDSGLNHFLTVCKGECPFLCFQNRKKIVSIRVVRIDEIVSDVQ